MPVTDRDQGAVHDPQPVGRLTRTEGPLQRQQRTEEAALERFAEFADAWGRKYLAIVKRRERPGRSSLHSCGSTPRSAASSCTTNAIEPVNARIRRAVKARGHFLNEQAALKCVYMAIMSLALRAKAKPAGPCAGRPR
ncbi:transposase [Streptomyces sp. NPDC058642]|uniref:transposase n=1 Tax=Streptomyces sp. NPDC058642 TaxID=3346572 RepID=UPI0036556F81